LLQGVMLMNSGFEILRPDHRPHGHIRAAVFDFDGTFSTLRCGWEQTMRPLMLEVLNGGNAEDAPEELQRKVDAYIDQSTGIQTVYQMRWLAEEADKAGKGNPGRDEWWYKDEYNRRLMKVVEERIRKVENHEMKTEQFLIAGAVSFLKLLKSRGIDVYLASGTDNEDVRHEASVLGVDGFFKEIKGAPEHKAACSKEAVMREIIEEKQIPGDRLLMIGDGKVEIALGAGCGAYTLGAATDEKSLCGVNAVKRERLMKAGADAITGDFTDLPAIVSWMGL